MSRPRYTCIESSETISTSPAARASSSASADLPDAVGPTSARCRRHTATTGMRTRRRASAPLDRSTSSPRNQCGAAPVTRTGHDLAGRGGRGRGTGPGREVQQLVLAGAARPHRGIGLRRSVDEHLLDPAAARLVVLERAALHDLGQAQPSARAPPRARRSRRPSPRLRCPAGARTRTCTRRRTARPRRPRASARSRRRSRRESRR